MNEGWRGGVTARDAGARARISAFVATLAALSCAGSAASRGAAATLVASAPTLVHESSHEPWFERLAPSSFEVALDLAPRAILADHAYGPLFRRATALALARASVTDMGTTTLSAIERAEDVRLVVRSRDPLDAVLIVSGAPSDVDPLHLTDGAGEPVWTEAPRHSSDVRELVLRGGREKKPWEAVLFAVGASEWVVGIGAGAGRVRLALEASFAGGTPGAVHPVRLERHGLVRVRFQSDALDGMRARAGKQLAPLARGLVELDASLGEKSSGALDVRFRYQDGMFVPPACARGKEVAASLASSVGPRLAFLKDAVFTCDPDEGRFVSIAATLPSGFLARFAEAAPEVGGAERGGDAAGESPP